MVRKICKISLTYARKFWTITKWQKCKLTPVEMKFLQRFEGKAERDKIRNEFSREKLRVVTKETTIG